MNSLQYESSPYLLQHQHNPVAWEAWKPEALARAQREQKPILVSIGYSTCHWCHVMERESFENEDVAALMNEHFVCIKVDREERPDVDAIYMEACQILTGSGGWPLNCFLTPDAKPFYAGTYFPPRPAYNRPSWPQLLLHLAKLWKEKPETIQEQAERLTAHIQRNDALPPQQGLSALPDFRATQDEAPKAMFERMREQFDPLEGGFGGAPKFPSTMAIQYLLDLHSLTGNMESLEHALLSLDKMTRGGIYDQIGGGFARYSTDREWLAPHFEKMLYDNALLLSALAEASKILQDRQRRGLSMPISGDLELYRAAVEDTIGFLFREMEQPGGAFYAALDADSEGVEGKFYVWDKAEIMDCLGAEGAVFCDFYDVSEAGNWEETNILRRTQSEAAFAKSRGLDVEMFKKTLEAQRTALFSRRAGRKYPGRDDKVLLAWNALTASAFVQVYQALAEEKYKEAAIRNIDFLLKNFEQPDEPYLLHHTWTDGKTQYNAFLDDYACLIAALIDVYHITFEQRYLQAAACFTERVFADFDDPDSGLFYFTGKGQTDVILRKKDLYDNAVPSGNSTMVHNLRRLSLLLDRPEWRERSLRMLQNMQPLFGKFPLSFGRWALALLYECHPPMELAIVGPEARQWAMSIQNMPLPNALFAVAESESSALPLLAGKTALGGKTQIYVCEGYACQAPVDSLEAFVPLARRL